MKKETYEKNLAYIFNPDRKGAKYSLNNGETWMNHGDFCECLAKSVLGFEAIKDANTPSHLGHDIPELNASVKSNNCGLSDRKDLKYLEAEEFVRKFFADEKRGTIYIYVFECGEEVTLYYMNRKEFRTFVKKFARYDNYCGKLRFPKSDTKVVAWLDTKVA